MDPLACFSDGSESESDDDDPIQTEKSKRKFNYKQLIDRGYVAPDLTTFVEGYRDIERKEQAEEQEKRRKLDKKEAKYLEDIQKAKAFAQKWDTWLEPAADEARAQLEAKKIARAAANVKRQEAGDKLWFASKAEANSEETSTQILSVSENTNTSLAIIDSTEEVNDLGSALVPVAAGQHAKDKSFPLVVTAESSQQRVMTFDSSGNRALVAVSTPVTTCSEHKSKPHLTHAQKIAKKWTEAKRKEARGAFDTKKGGGVENLPVKQLVTTYNQRLNNIMHMEKNLDTLLKKAKPTYKDQRTDMAYDDLRKCGAGAGN